MPVTIQPQVRFSLLPIQNRYEWKQLAVFPDGQTGFPDAHTGVTPRLSRPANESSFSTCLGRVVVHQANAR